MAEANKVTEEIEKMKLFDFKEEKKEESVLFSSVEDKCMLECLNSLDDHETNVDKIAKATLDLLLTSSIKDAKQVIKECQEDEKTVSTEAQIKKKLPKWQFFFMMKS